MKITMLVARTTTNSPPALVTDGFPLRGANAGQEGLREMDAATLLVASTAGSGTMSVQLRVWGYSPISGVWHTVKDINAAAVIPEVLADTLRYSELVAGLSAFDRVYVEVVAINGSATAVSAWFVARNEPVRR